LSAEPFAWDVGQRRTACLEALVSTMLFVVEFARTSARQRDAGSRSRCGLTQVRPRKKHGGPRGPTHKVHCETSLRAPATVSGLRRGGGAARLPAGGGRIARSIRLELLLRGRLLADGGLVDLVGLHAASTVRSHGPAGPGRNPARSEIGAPRSPSPCTRVETASAWRLTEASRARTPI